MEMELPEPYFARAYRGAVDHPAMAAIRTEYDRSIGMSDSHTVEQFDITYANLTHTDPAIDVVIVEAHDDNPIGYVRTSWEDLDDGIRECIAFWPTRPEHLTEPLYRAILKSVEQHMRSMAVGAATARFRLYAPHPGPGLAATGPASWLESAGYDATRFVAALVRPNLDDIAVRPLPHGIEVRAVLPEMIRPIWDAHSEAFRGSWDFREETEEAFQQFRDNPLRDESLWKVAWTGDTIVGQVKSFINHEENADVGYLRGYTEDISTHVDWRNRGIAGALLAMSLRELKARGMTQAALAVDTENPGGAFQLYTELGFELQAYEVIYTKPVT